MFFFIIQENMFVCLFDNPKIKIQSTSLSLLIEMQTYSKFFVIPTKMIQIKLSQNIVFFQYEQICNDIESFWMTPYKRLLFLENKK